MKKITAIYACFPVVSSIGATNALHAGIIPRSDQPVRSVLVPISWAP